MQLRPHESVLFPNPYEEDKYNPVIVTSQRIFQRLKNVRKPVEFESKNVTYVGKGNNRTFMVFMIFFGLVGAPFLITGGLMFYTVKDKPTEAPEVPKGKPKPVLKASQIREFEETKEKKILGIVLGVFGAAFCGGAYLFFKRRLQVVAGGKGKVLRFNVKDAGEQDKLMMMIQASKTAAGATAASMPKPGAGGAAAPGAPPKAPGGIRR